MQLQISCYYECWLTGMPNLKKKMTWVSRNYVNIMSKSFHPCLCRTMPL